MPAETIHSDPASASKWRESCRVEFSALADTELGAAELVERYSRFCGPTWEGIRRSIMKRIVEKLNQAGHRCSQADIFGPDFEIIQGSVAAQLLGARYYMRPLEVDGLANLQLLPPSVNTLVGSALPYPLEKGMASPVRRSLDLYEINGCDIFVTPEGYQVFRASDQVYWPAASTHAYSSEILRSRDRVIDNSVVIVQDIFSGSNFSHFLFDWMPRLSHFLSATSKPYSSFTFLMGGIGGPFQRIVIGRMCKIYGLKPEQFVFPAQEEVWHVPSSVFFFSDLKRAPMHPAHTAHPYSVALIRDITRGVLTSTGKFDQIYISRADASLRRIVNEAELWPGLSSLGFSMVRLAEMSVPEQIAIVRGASVIVAPHGMGLTHIAFHPGRPRVVELFNGSVGTSSYATIAQALGFSYHAIFGEDVGNGFHDFSVSVDAVWAALTDDIKPKPRPVQFSILANEDLQAVWHGGTQPLPASPTSHLPPPVEGTLVLRHAASEAVDDNNFGWLEVRQARMPQTCVVSCQIWIPKSFRGGKVALELSNLKNATHLVGDLSKRDQWQEIRISGTYAQTPANFVLRINAGPKDVPVLE